MTPRLRAAAAGCAIALAGCSGHHPVTLGDNTRPPRRATALIPPAPRFPGPEALSPPAADALSGTGAAAVAARFTIAYLSAAPGDGADARRRRCRPLDTDGLDRLLGAPSWPGAANATPPGRTVTATVDTVVAAETTPVAAGYELSVTVTAVAAGRSLYSEQRAVQLWLTATPQGAWRASQVSVT
jgi:hypothetical protein